jgi:DNA-binding FadR family transcriptional regulator
MGTSLLDALDFRWVVEPAAAALAAQRTTAGEVQRLERLLGETHTGPRSEYRQADSRFHLAIAETAGSPSLAAAVADVQLRLSDLLAAIPLLEKALRHSDQQHARLLEAIAAGDSSGARAAMEQHVSATATLLRGFLG